MHDQLQDLQLPRGQGRPALGGIRGELLQPRIKYDRPAGDPLDGFREVQVERILEQIAARPRLQAGADESGRSECMLNISTIVSGADFRICLVATAPFMLGSAKSITTTAG